MSKENDALLGLYCLWTFEFTDKPWITEYTNVSYCTRKGFHGVVPSVCARSLWAMGITHIHTGSLRGYGLYYISFVRSSRIYFTHGDRGWQASSSEIAKFMGPTWGQPGSCRSQMGPMLAQWTLLSGMCFQKGIFLALHHSLAITQPFVGISYHPINQTG